MFQMNDEIIASRFRTLAKCTRLKVPGKEVRCKIVNDLETTSQVKGESSLNYIFNSSFAR